MEELDVTTVSSSGSATTEYDVAFFGLSTFVDAESQPLAKLALKDRVAELEPKIQAILENYKVSVIKGTISSLNDVKPRHEWRGDRNELIGYRGNYSYEFKTDSMEIVSKIYDELSSLHGVTMPTPSFSLKNPDALNKAALKDAWRKVCDRFADQCDVFGLHPKDYEIAHWQVDYSDTPVAKKAAAAQPFRATLLAGQAENAPEERVIELIIPSTRVSVSLSISFKEK